MIFGLGKYLGNDGHQIGNLLSNGSGKTVVPLLPPFFILQLFQNEKLIYVYIHSLWPFDFLGLCSWPSLALAVSSEAPSPGEPLLVLHFLCMGGGVPFRAYTGFQGIEVTLYMSAFLFTTKSRVHVHHTHICITST